MDFAPASIVDESKIDGNTPTMRLFALLEVIACKDQFFSLQSLVDELGLPKPTLHRMLQQLEGAGMIQRDGDGRQYSTGLRLRRMAENLLLNNTVHGARHGVLSQLVEEVGESCNITACTGSEVLYLDRVETAAPLRFHLRPGACIPLHCSASGKLFLTQMTPLQRRRLLTLAPLTRYTDKTLTAYEALDREIERVRRDGYATDNEEFLLGLRCIAVLVPAAGGKSNMAMALQVPTLRMTAAKALQCLPALQRAARSLANIELANGKGR
ncbi:IclR family transcriptional regulator [Candidimonas nitroreducens]|uniref:IclR family transcriptional regulator n=1 Tax=Candidimonas nitroreducens TaxID=683354 RepID=A0A225M9A6_9BURK|nr:IclR family transcriptional regulator [Candidimonas nitroreducens]OWT56131.1 IclR family transcriptional regulator [Candidimonas nitroreducens]